MSELLTSNPAEAIVDFDISGMSAPVAPGWDIWGATGLLSFYHRAAAEETDFFGKRGIVLNMVFQEQLTLATTGHGAMHDLTAQIAAVVARSKIRTGIVHVFNVGSTAALGAIEFEPGLEKDLPALLDRLIPPSRAYGHEQTWHDGNGHSHLQATLLGPSLTVPVGEGRPILGTWQQIIHLECDTRPRQRTVVVTVMGE